MKKILTLFFVLVLVKTVLSLPFESPWVFGDAAIYTAKTRAILQGNFYFDEFHYGGPKVPPLYSAALAPAYFFDDPFLNYRFILIINAILTSLIVFPAFFMARRFLRDEFSFLLAALIGVYPSLFGFSYMVMSENLFYPLLLFSAWLFLLTMEKPHKRYDILLGIFLGALALTRAVGIFPAAAFLGVSFLQLFGKHNSAFLKRKLLTLIFLAIPIFWWVYVNKGAGVETTVGYDISDYLHTVFSILTEKTAFMTALKAAFSQITFIVISSYFVFLPFMFLGLKREKKFWPLFLFTVINIVLFLGASVTHQVLFLQKDPVRYLIFGRYIEPVVPLIILLGGIVFFTRRRLFMLPVVLILPFLARFFLPGTDYDLVNNVSLISFMGHKFFDAPFILPLWIILFLIFSLIMFFPKDWLKKSFVFLLIIFSLTAFYPVYFLELSASHELAGKLGAYHWIAENIDKGETIGFDKDQLWEKNLIHSFWLYEFWLGKQYHLKLVDPQATDLGTDLRYVISDRDLPFAKPYSGKPLAVYRLQ